MENAPHDAEPLVVERALALARDHERAGQRDEAEFLYRQVLGVHPDSEAARDGMRELHGEAAQSTLTKLRAALGPEQRRAFPARVHRRWGRPVCDALAQRPRVWKYRALSTCSPLLTAGRPVVHQPVLFLGSGQIVLGRGVQFGWPASPLYYTGYCHLEAFTPDARIELGDRVEFNNNAMLKSGGAGIRVGRDGLFGAHVEVFDTDFHDLHPQRRRDGTPRMAEVDIGENVFVGMSVKILKGVTIGADSVIGAGAVVTSSIPAGVVAAGNPARVVRQL